MHTRNLLRPIRAYAGKPTILSNLSPCGDAANNVYPDQTAQLAAPNRCLLPSRENNNSQQKLSNLLRLVNKITIQIYLRAGTQQILHTKIRRRSLLCLIRAYTSRQVTNKQTKNKKKKSQQNNHLNFSPYWEATNNVYPDQMPQLVTTNRDLHHQRESNNSQQYISVLMRSE